MARASRIEFPGAIYHIFNRGNYRKPIFADAGSSEAFVKILFEALESRNWILHAFVVMVNHYHLLLETPEGNLVKGMQWLQSVYANRFNRFRGESGHVFQGRYRSPLVEPGDALRRVADYIHLNPVRAGLAEIDQLDQFGLSSYQFFSTNSSPARLTNAHFLKALNLPANMEGMREYGNWLKIRAQENPELEEEQRQYFHHQWVIGSEEYRNHIVEKYVSNDPSIGIAGPTPEDLEQGKWEALLQYELQNRKISENDLAGSPKLATWKIELSQILRRRSGASNRWIADRLNMGHHSNVSRYLKKKPKPKV